MKSAKAYREKYGGGVKAAADGINKTRNVEEINRKWRKAKSSKIIGVMAKKWRRKKMTAAAAAINESVKSV
jgi:hypothetical protein